MNDKNGIELRTGQVVEITGSFFKTDNGRYVIIHAPGDKGWCGKDCCLHKVSKKNEFSLAKYSLAFWPLSACTSDYCKNLEADAHNAKNAQIEIVGEISDVEIKEEIADCEIQKKCWRGNLCAIRQLQERIDKLKAQLSI